MITLGIGRAVVTTNAATHLPYGPLPVLYLTMVSKLENGYADRSEYGRAARLRDRVLLNEDHREEWRLWCQKYPNHPMAFFYTTAMWKGVDTNQFK